MKFIIAIIAALVGSVCMAAPGDKRLYSFSSTGNVLFSTNGQDRVYVTPSGKVGVGTSTPTTALDVTGALTLSGPTEFSYIDPAGNTKMSKVYIPAIDDAATEVFSFSMAASINAAATAITVQDARTAVHSPTISALSPSDFALLGFGFDQGTDTEADIDVIGFGTNFADIVMRPSGGSGVSQEALRLKGGSGAAVLADTGGNGGNIPHNYSKVIGSTVTTASTCAAQCPANAIALGGDCASTVITTALTGTHTTTTSTTDDTFNCDYLSAAGSCTATAKCLIY